ncbi:MAG: hypothetical protein IJ001_08720 [Oscillospiraceae bacterium]|nr:hypothetical protein [Oscillospiraceae bacterium]
MKKHDEGYTIPLVLVVMVIMILVASLVLANSLQTAQNQQEAILQMKDKYAAEGKIEILVAQLLQESEYTSMTEISENAVHNELITLCASAGVTLADTTVTNEAGETVIEAPQYSLVDGVLTYIFTVNAEQNTTKITTQLKLECKIEKDASSDADVVKTPKITYNTYQIGGATE